MLPHSWSTTCAWNRNDSGETWKTPTNGTEIGSGGPGQPEALILLHKHAPASASSAAVSPDHQKHSEIGARRTQGHTTSFSRVQMGWEGREAGLTARALFTKKSSKACSSFLAPSKLVGHHPPLGHTQAGQEFSLRDIK